MVRHVPECSVFRVLSTANCLACEFTAYNAYKNAEMNLKSTITKYQRIQLLNNKFINGILGGTLDLA